MESDVDILLVDDRPENLLAIEAVLGSEPCRLVRATSGYEALLRILEQDFAVILIDVVMPGMDGFEVVEIIKQRERSRYTPIIFLTADGSNMDFIYRAYSVGAVDYLTKPIDPDVLRAKVRVFADLCRKDRCIREQAEALNEQRYRNLAEAIPHVVWTASPAGEITYFNRRWQEYTAQSPDEARGEGWMAAIAADDAERCAIGWHDGIAGRSVFELEARVRRHDGAVRWHLCRAVPEYGDGGRLVAWLGTFTDCDELKRAWETSERAVHARDEFLSIASHELRTPLTTLQLRLRSLSKDGGGKVESCLRQSGRLVALVESLFDFSRITSGKLELKREPFDLSAAARDAVERLAELARVPLSIEADDVVAGCWDRLRVEQVIENLLSNAIKYGANGPITIAVRTCDGIARITVTDRGPGIASDDLPRIFGAFERASSTVSYAGMGLGLFIAREYTAAHGGTISATSTPDAGTTFTVELPLQ